MSHVGKCRRLGNIIDWEASHIFCLGWYVSQAGKCQNSDWKSCLLSCFLVSCAIDKFVKLFLELFWWEFGSNRSWKWKKRAMQIGYRQVGKVLQQKINKKKSFTKTQMFFVFIKFHKLSHTIIAWIGKTETETWHDDWIGYILNVRSLPNRHRAFEIE